MNGVRTEGLVIGVVQEVGSNEHAGEVKLRYPTLGDQVPEKWISICSHSAGPDSGMFFMPEPGDELIVGFVNNNPEEPFVVGATWNPRNQAPSTDHRQRMLRSRNGHTIRFIDSTPGSGNVGALVIEDGHGNVISMFNGCVAVQAKGTLVLKGTQIVMAGEGWVRPVEPSIRPI